MFSCELEKELIDESIPQRLFASRINAEEIIHGFDGRSSNHGSDDFRRSGRGNVIPANVREAVSQNESWQRLESSELSERWRVVNRRSSLLGVTSDKTKIQKTPGFGSASYGNRELWDDERSIDHRCPIEEEIGHVVQTERIQVMMLTRIHLRKSSKSSQDAFVEVSLQQEAPEDSSLRRSHSSPLSSVDGVGDLSGKRRSSLFQLATDHVHHVGQVGANLVVPNWKVREDVVHVVQRPTLLEAKNCFDYL